MGDGVPLRQLLEPGQYRVEWRVPSPDGSIVDVQGDLTLEADRSPHAQLFDTGSALVRLDSVHSMSFPRTYEAEMVTGTLLNGHTVVLVDASIQSWFPGRATIRARAALVGRMPQDPPNPEITEVEVQVSGLDAIAGIGPIRQVKIPLRREEGQRYLDWSWEAVGQPDSTQVWSDADVEIELRFYSSVTAPEAYFFRVSFSPVVLIRFSKPVSFDAVFTGWVEPLRTIVALATARQEKITYVAVTPADQGSESKQLQVYGTALHQAPYSSQGNDILKIDRAFFLSPDDMSLLDMLRLWQQLAREHHPLLETYGSMMFAPVQHPRSRFLLLLQAIEGLYGHETAAVYTQRAVEHGARRGEVLAEIESAVGHDALRFLKKHLARRPPASLTEAIRAMLGSVPVDVTPALTHSDLVVAAMSDLRAPQTVYDALRMIRNDLAHGARGGYDTQALHDVVELLDGVVRAHMLRVLGCSEGSQRASQERQR